MIKCSPHLLGGGDVAHEVHDPPVDDVPEHGLEDLAQEEHDAAAEPLVLAAQLEHLVHQQQQDAQGDVVVSLGQGGKVLIKVSK